MFDSIKRIRGAVVGALFDVIVLVILLELALRIVPSLIPGSLLVDFDPSLRSAIAERIGLSRLADTVPIVRGDGGPPFTVYRPHAVVRHDIDDADAIESVSMDSMGFCNVPADAGDRMHNEIILIGDSIAWCTGVRPEDTFASKLGRKTKAAAYNISTLGIGPYEYIELLKQFGIQKSPKIVILNIYGGNDLRDVIAYASYREAVRASGGMGVASSPCSLSRALCPLYRTLKEGPFGRTSYAFNLIRNVLRKGLEHVRTFAKRALERDSPGQEVNFRYRIRTADGKTIAFNSKNSDLDEVEYARYIVDGRANLEIFTQPLEAFKNLALEQHFTPVVTYLPSAYSAYGEEVTFEDPAVGEILKIASERERLFLADKTRELGIAFLDLTLPLMARSRDSASDENLYFPTSVHLTRFGHEVVASSLANFLQSQGMLR